MNAGLTCILVERQDANLTQGVIFVRPYLCHVENIPLVFLCIPWLHDLHVNVPLGVVAPFNGVVEILQVMIWCRTGHSSGRLPIQAAASKLGLQMNLGVAEGAILYNTKSQKGKGLGKPMLPLRAARLCVDGASMAHFFGKLVRMAAEGVHLPEALRSASVAEQIHELVDALRVSDVEAAEIRWVRPQD